MALNNFATIEQNMRGEFQRLMNSARGLKSTVPEPMNLYNHYVKRWTNLQANLQEMQAATTRAATTKAMTPWLTPILDSLIDLFDEAAHQYYNFAVQTIRCAVEKDIEVPVEYYFGQVLLRIADHIRLLSELVYLDRDQNQLAQNMIWGIASRFAERPILVPMPTGQFQYVHFNYVNNFGIIGFPNDLLITPELSLPVLWHEVGGYHVAGKRESGDLEKLAGDLRETLSGKVQPPEQLWLDYRFLYEKSRLKFANIQIQLNPTSCRVTGSAFIRRYFQYLTEEAVTQFGDITVDTDPTWQMAWLGECFEDMFGALALGESMLNALSRVLPRVYADTALGDSTHPSPDLRIQVVIEFLALLGKLESDSDKPSIAPDQQETARRIARLYYDTYRLKVEQPPDQINLHNHEQQVVALFNKILEHPALVEDETLADELATIRSDYMDYVQTFTLRLAKADSATGWIGQSQNCDNLSKEQAQKQLEALGKIRFVSSDETGPERGRDILPPFGIPG